MKQPVDISPELKALLINDNIQIFKSLKLHRGGVYGKQRKTILHLAAKYCSKIAIPVYCHLVLKVNPRTKTQKTHTCALHYACAKGNLLLVKFLLSLRECCVDPLRKNGETPLFIAIKYNRTDIAELLISRGANIHLQDKKKWTMAHWACRNGNAKILSLLVDKGISLQNLTADFESCLHLAAWRGDLEIFKLLFPLFCPFIIGNKGTLLHYARGN